MELATLLEKNREAILARWFSLIARTYPRATSQFLATQKDQFRNPVGHALSQSIREIFDQVVSTMDSDELVRALDGIIRIRSVQDFAPSEALAFTFQLKTVIREILDAQLPGAGNRREFAAIESRIDRVALLAFDKYMECREKLHDIRKKQIESTTIKLLQRVGGNPAISRHQEDLLGEDA
jgi:hypothetical protein